MFMGKKLSSSRLLLWGLPLAVLIIGGGIFTLSPRYDTAFGDSQPLQILWLEAEKAATPELAVQAWEKLAQKISHPDSLIATGVAGKDVAKMLFAAEIAAKQWDKAEAQLATWQGKEQLYAHLLLAQALAESNPKKAWELLIPLDEKRIATLPTRHEQSHAAFAVASVALMQQKGKAVFPWNGADKAEKMLPYLITGRLRADILHRLAKVKQPPAEGEIQTQLHAALMLPLEEAEKRDAALQAIHKTAKEADLFYPALDALSGIENDNLQQQKIYEWCKELLEKKQYSRAIAAAERLDEDRRGASAWARLARYFADSGHSDRAKTAQKWSYDSALFAKKADDKAEAFADIAEQLIKSGDTERGLQALQNIPASLTKQRNHATGKIIKALAESRQLEQAQTLLKDFTTEDENLKSMVYAAVAKSLAEKKSPEEAVSSLEKAGKLVLTPQLDKARAAIAKSFAKRKQFSEATAFAALIMDSSLQDEVQLFIRQKQEQTEKKRLNNESLSENTPVAEQRLENAPAFLSRPTASDEAIANEAFALLQDNHLADAARKLQEISEPRFKVLQFRRLAEAQAAITDYYHLLPQTTPSQADTSFLKPKTAVTHAVLSDSALDSFENTLSQQTLHTSANKHAASSSEQESVKQEQGLSIVTLPVSDLGNKIPALPAKETLALTDAHLRAALPMPRDFSFSPIFFGNNYFVNSKFKTQISNAPNTLKQAIFTPDVLLLEHGTATLPQLYDALMAQGKTDYLTRSGTEYTLRHPLVIAPNASLIIEGTEVSTLYLSKQTASILVNAGKIYIQDTHLVGWDETTASPTLSTYETKLNFRPFIISWSGSETFMGGSISYGLGYSKSKSFGLSLTAGPKKFQENTLTELERPTGKIINNSFINSHYGFYSFEADNVALIGNEYQNNVIYGIDPHDRSRWLSIAYNTAYDSQRKHGIIISREVDDSSYIGNLSFDNNGSGFMIDRMSNGTYIYANTAFSNKQDGMTLFESSCNLIASNHFFDNKLMGIRIRNSQNNGVFYNRFHHNGQGGVYAYRSLLQNQAAQATRDFVMDPYGHSTAMTMIGNHLQENGAGIIADDASAMTLRGNHFVKQSPKLIQGSWLQHVPYLTSQYDLQHTGAVISETCPKGDWLNYPCRFRKQGIFKGDGQRDLPNRLQRSPCRQSQPPAKA
jgi:poly(beta-D-mannuronate) C5 epimerase